jgi:hypothetical protein
MIRSLSAEPHEPARPPKNRQSLQTHMLRALPHFPDPRDSRQMRSFPVLGRFA